MSFGVALSPSALRRLSIYSSQQPQEERHCYHFYFADEERGLLAGFDTAKIRTRVYLQVPGPSLSRLGNSFPSSRLRASEKDVLAKP